DILHACSFVSLLCDYFDFLTATATPMAYTLSLHDALPICWGKALWGKLYGQWLCEGAVFTYDFDRFDAEKILPMFAKYHITTFRSEEHTSELQSRFDLVCRLLLEKKKYRYTTT